MTTYVLDACALVAYLCNEPGFERVETILASGDRVCMSAINVLEVCYDGERRQGNSSAANEVLRNVDALGIEVLATLDRNLLLSASTFKARGRISLADAIALALAQQLNARLVTADHHEFDPIEKAGLASFEWIR